MARYIIIGAGKFGYYATHTLFEAGAEVIVIDHDKSKVEALQRFSSHGFVADASDKKALEEIGVGKNVTALVSVGGNISASILITLFLKELDVPTIIVKATSEEHGRALEKVGATEIIFPERDMAKKTARNLIYPNILDSLTLSPDYTIIELAPPKEFIGHSLAELDLRNRYKITVIAVREIVPESFIVNPPAAFVITDSSVLIVLGKRSDFEAIPKD